MAEPAEPPLAPISGGVRVPLAIGVCLVGYSYLAALWLNRHGSTPEPLLFVREWVNKPLGIGEDFGVFGIALLLISSGYLISSALTVDSVPRTFATVATRAAVPVAVAVTAGALITLGGGLPFTEPAEVDVTLPGYLSDLLLVGALTKDGSLLGLGWVLTVGAMFLVLLLATLPVARLNQWAAPALQLLVLATITLTGPIAQGWYHELGKLAPFVAMPVLGRIFRLVKDGRFSGWTSAPLAIGCLALLIVAEDLYADLAGWMYPLTALYAAATVLLALSSGERLAKTVPIGWVASRALSLFLMVGVVGYAAVSALHLKVPLSVAFPTAAVLTGLAAEGCHRLATVFGRLIVRAPSPEAGR